MTDSNSKSPAYVPIPCANYDTYEIAIMHRRPLQLSWTDDNVYHHERVTPLNLETRSGEEFLILRTADGELRRVRLDKIRKVETL